MENKDKNKNNGGAGGDYDLDALGRDPLLIALLKEIPTSGEWPAALRVRWFKTGVLVETAGQCFGAIGTVPRRAPSTDLLAE